MKLWEYLKNKMTPFKDRVAIYDLGLTYADILEYNGGENDGRLKVCDGETNAELAVSILKAIAECNVAVPVTKAYGTDRYKYICDTVSVDKDTYSDLAFIMFTSGTTGKPKGVMLTDENIITNLEYISAYFDVSNTKKICISRSLVHIAALTGELLYALINGLTIYFYEHAFNPVKLTQYLNENGIDVFCATPTVFNLLARFNKGFFAPRIAAISGERLTSKTAIDIARKFPYTEFYNVYGLTEHSPRAAALLPEDFTERHGSIGKPIGDVEMTISNGELLIRSPCVMKGYYKTETDNIRDGWLHTGDAAHVDFDGFYYIDGRMDDMIIRAGVNIFPQEIESVLTECDGVTECVAYGQFDPMYGQKITVAVNGTVTLPVLREYAAEHLPPHLIPNEYIMGAVIEHTVSGKLKRRVHDGT